MSTPCYKDPDFVGDAVAMARARRKCASCPAQAPCFELGLGQEDGVYAGTLPSHPDRRRMRASVDRTRFCRNGHPKDTYGLEIEGPGKQMIPGCTRCADLQLRIVELS